MCRVGQNICLLLFSCGLLAAETRFGLPVATVEGASKITIFAEGALPEKLGEMRSTTAAFLEVPPTAVSVESIAKIPLTASGKKNYQAL